MTIPGRPYRVALVQSTCAPRPEANVAAAAARVGEAARRGADVVCLQELFRTPYFCQTESTAAFDLAERIPGPTTAALARAARRHRVVVIAPVFERRAAGLFHNSAVVIDADGSIAGIYRKMHIPDDPGYYEKFYFAPGDLGFPAFDTRAGRIAVLICWDQWYPEAARLAALRGASLLVYPTAIGWHPHERATLGDTQREAWRTVQRGHAVANGVFVAAVNRVGHETPPDGGPGIHFWGSSFLAGPQGEILAEAPDDREALLLGTVDPAQIERVRRAWPFLRDRRIDAYGDILSRFLDGPTRHPPPRHRSRKRRK